MIGKVFCIAAIFVSVAAGADIQAVKVIPRNAGNALQYYWLCYAINGKTNCTGLVLVKEDLTDITMTLNRRRCDLNLQNCQPYSVETSSNLCGVTPGSDSSWGHFIASIGFDGKCPLPKGLYYMRSTYVTPKFLPDNEHCWIDTLINSASGVPIAELNFVYCVPQELPEGEICSYDIEISDVEFNGIDIL